MLKEKVINQRTMIAANFIIITISLVIICITLASLSACDETMIFNGTKSVYKWGTDASVWTTTAADIYLSGIVIAIVVMLAYTLELLRTSSPINTTKALVLYGGCLFCIVFTEVSLLLLSLKYNLSLFTVNDIGEAIPFTDDYGTTVDLHNILRVPRMLSTALDVFVTMIIFFIIRQRSKA